MEVVEGSGGDITSFLGLSKETSTATSLTGYEPSYYAAPNLDPHGEDLQTVQTP